MGWARLSHVETGQFHGLRAGNGTLWLNSRRERQVAQVAQSTVVGPASGASAPALAAESTPSSPPSGAASDVPLSAEESELVEESCSPAPAEASTLAFRSATAASARVNRNPSSRLRRSRRVCAILEWPRRLGLRFGRRRAPREGQTPRNGQDLATAHENRFKWSTFRATSDTYTAGNGSFGQSSANPLAGMSTIALSARSVTKRVTDGQARREVLKGITLDLGRGELMVVRGASGSGKTTLLARARRHVADPPPAKFGSTDEPISRLRDHQRADPYAATKLARYFRTSGFSSG